MEFHASELFLAFGFLIMIAGVLAKKFQSGSGSVSTSVRTDSPKPKSKSKMTHQKSRPVERDTSDAIQDLDIKVQKQQTAQAPKKEVVVNEKTRGEIATLFSSLKSVTAEEVSSSDEQETPFKELDEAIQVRISDVLVEETEKGKFSKLTIEAPLIFEEDDLKIKLDDWETHIKSKGKKR